MVAASVADVVADIRVQRAVDLLVELALVLGAVACVETEIKNEAEKKF